MFIPGSRSNLDLVQCRGEHSEVLNMDDAALSILKLRMLYTEVPAIQRRIAKVYQSEAIFGTEMLLYLWYIKGLHTRLIHL